MPLDGRIADYVKATNEVAETLRRARALIDTPEKWVKRAAMRGSALCLLGAINMSLDRSCGILHSNAPLYSRAVLMLERAADDPRVSSGAWNDAPERTHADVMAAFDRAIALAEQE